MDIDEIRNVLFQSMDDQLAADIAANEEAQKLGQQKIMYANEGRGTLYSGQPTWERAQLAAEGTQNLAKIYSNDLSNRVKVWDTITDTLDKINSYNEAAKALTASTSSNTASQSFLDIYNSLTGGN